MILKSFFLFFFSPQVSEEQRRAVSTVPQLHFSNSEQTFKSLHILGSCQVLILTGEKVLGFSKTSAWVNYG